MSEEEELKGIRREVWWLSTFLVKIPLIISAFVAVVWIAQSCSGNVDAPSEQPSEKTMIKVAVTIVVIAVNVLLLTVILPRVFRGKTDKPKQPTSEDETKPNSNADEE